jgi:molybdate transport system substrate-binding protein
LVLAGWLILDGPAQQGDEPLTVAAAANLQFAFTEIGQLFEAETGQAVVFSFGSSGNLAHQIEHGAPVDVFAAANAAYVDELQAQDLIVASSRQVYAQGRVVLAVHRASGVQVTSLQDLLGADVTYVALANPAHAPYGLAAQQALQSAGLWEALQPKLVYGETVHQAMRFVQTGNAETGLIALAVADVPELDYTLVDASLHQPLNQVIAVIQGTPRLAASESFVAFVRGPQGQRVLRRYGFEVPDNEH